MPYLLLRFCTLGCIAGSVGFIAGLGLATDPGALPVNVHQFVSLVLDVALVAVLSSFISVPLGFFPAALAAFAYWLVLLRYTTANPRPIMRVILGGGIGATISSVFGGALFSTGHAPGSHPFEVNLAAWFVAGAVGGATGAIASGTRTYRALRRDAKRVA